MTRGFALAGCLILAVGCRDGEERSLAEPIDQSLRMLSQHAERETLLEEHRELLGAAQTVTGKVTLADDDEVVIDSPGQPPLILRIDRNTSITIDGVELEDAGEIPVGTEVRADFKQSASVPVANRIQDTGRVPVGGHR